jgi:hypothetical protein
MVSPFLSSYLLRDATQLIPLLLLLLLPYKNPKNRTPPVGGGTYILGEGVIEKFLTLSLSPSMPSSRERQ